MSLSRVWSLVKHPEVWPGHVSAPHDHHGPQVPLDVAVVGSAEEGDQLTLGEELVPVLHHLVGPADQVEVVLVEELGRHLRSERERHAAVVLAPTHRVLQIQMCSM